MIEQDTIKLLRECDAGVKMGIDSIEQVLEYVKDSELRSILSKCKTEHENMKEDISILLAKAHDDGHCIFFRTTKQITQTQQALKYRQQQHIQKISQRPGSFGAQLC